MKSNLQDALRVVAALVVTVGFIVESPAATYQVNLGGGGMANAIPIPVFDTSLGWLQEADLKTILVSGTTNSAGAHTHGLNHVFHAGGTTSFTGNHVNSVSVPTFSGGGLSLVPISNFNVNTLGSHAHSVNAAASQTATAGNHFHFFNTQSRVTQFGSGSLAPFLGAADFTMTGALSQTSTAANKTHTYSDFLGVPAAVSPAGSHAHSFTDRWRTETTFTYTANAEPTAAISNSALYIGGGSLVLDATASSDVDLLYGDSLTYEWDLDNDSIYDVSTTDPVFTLPVQDVSLYYPNLGVYPIRLKVTDAFATTSTILTTLNAQLQGDANNDGDVDFGDFLKLQVGFGTTSGATQGDGDLNGDGEVDFQDFIILQNQFGSVFDSLPGGGDALAAQAVPEPSTMLLASIGLVTVLAHRRRTKR